MAATTTIRISTDTRDLLRALSARRGRSSGDVVAELARKASDDLLLADAEAGFKRMANGPALAAYRNEAHEIARGFDADASIPDW